MSKPVELPVVLPFNPADVLLGALAQAWDHPQMRLIFIVVAILFLLNLLIPTGTRRQGKRYRRRYRY